MSRLILCMECGAEFRRSSDTAEDGPCPNCGFDSSSIPPTEAPRRKPRKKSRKKPEATPPRRAAKRSQDRTRKQASSAFPQRAKEGTHAGLDAIYFALWIQAALIPGSLAVQIGIGSPILIVVAGSASGVLGFAVAGELLLIGACIVGVVYGSYDEFFPLAMATVFVALLLYVLPGLAELILGLFVVGTFLSVPAFWYGLIRCIIANGVSFIGRPLLLSILASTVGVSLCVAGALGIRSLLSDQDSWITASTAQWLIVLAGACLVATKIQFIVFLRRVAIRSCSQELENDKTLSYIDDYLRFQWVLFVSTFVVTASIGILVALAQRPRFVVDYLVKIGPAVILSAPLVLVVLATLAVADAIWLARCTAGARDSIGV